MIDELYLYSYANEPNKSPGRERLGALLPLRETTTFPHQADHVLVVFFFIPGRSATSAHFTLLGPELGQLANDG